ncbi:hypothetical protein N656DRAFT_794152 [Canariomyces notabilis]|uniref:Uncharacterized protein n=1 Tax=Canariomyces notabilis TaxID=2074819 RepID=A0AAN6YY02_9PEZI|nr:hypothetical protein N656DRAFT_794152 [Canariomyces arenarius]
MAEEPTLPRLPSPLASASRGKRTFGGGVSSPELSTSSDPAFFSSDDDPALDNYQGQGRRKRRYVGAWFDQHPASSDSGVDDETRATHVSRRNKARPRPKKREFRRQLDSGVWMGTDGALTDTDDGVDLEPVPARLPLVPRQAPAPGPLAPARPRLSVAEEAVQNTVLRCLDNGNELVDLSGLQLEKISDGLIEPISNICPIPNVAKDVAFEQRDPQIKIFLSNNRLRTLPLALLNIEHLTVLSLRANQLTKLPPGIAKLRNLRTLNIAQNALRFLPAELLGLLQKGSKLTEMQFQPNPFWVPGPAPPQNIGGEEYLKRTFGPQPDVGFEASWAGLTTKLHSRTPVQFTDDTCELRSSFVLPVQTRSFRAAIELEPFQELATPTGFKTHASAETNRAVRPRGAKSLLELTLRACAASGQAEEIASWLREESWPAHLATFVEKANEFHQSGGGRCSVCGRDMVVPMTSWIEFRQIGRTTVTKNGDGGEVCRFMGLVGESEGPVPFMRSLLPKALIEHPANKISTQHSGYDGNPTTAAYHPYPMDI